MHVEDVPATTHSSPQDATEGVGMHPYTRCVLAKARTPMKKANETGLWFAFLQGSDASTSQRSVAW